MYTHTHISSFLEPEVHLWPLPSVSGLEVSKAGKRGRHFKREEQVSYEKTCWNAGFEPSDDLQEPI